MECKHRYTTAITPLRLAWGALLLSLAACGSGDSRPGKAFHVLVISLGTGATPDAASAPNLFQFAATSTGFHGLTSDHGSALGNSASLLTGLTPEEHGAGQGPEQASVLPANQTPLPEYLVDHGYNTGAVIASACELPPESGLDQGFGEYQTIPGTATEVAWLAENWIEHHLKQPFFLFVHFPVDAQAPGAESAALADEGLGILLRSLAKQGILDSSLVLVIGAPGSTDPLFVKAPGQRAALSDPRPVELVHVPQLLLEHVALPVAAVRPNSYFTHALAPVAPPTTPTVAKDGNR